MLTHTYTNAHACIGTGRERGEISIPLAHSIYPTTTMTGPGGDQDPGSDSHMGVRVPSTEVVICCLQDILAGIWMVVPQWQLNML